jgi:hypothetical protein
MPYAHPRITLQEQVFLSMMSNHDIANAACLAHCQNFSAAGESAPAGAAIPIIDGFGSGVRRNSLTRLPAE